MGLKLAQLYVKGADPAKLRDCTLPLWQQSTAADSDAAKRQLAVLATPSGWHVFIDSADSVPRELGLQITKAAGGQSVWVSVNSAALLFEFVTTTRSRITAERRFPEPDPKDPDRMPLYIDAEIEAWDFLSQCEIPARYRMLRLREISRVPVTDPGAANLTLIEGGQSTGWRFRIENPRTEESGPPKEYHFQMSNGATLMDLYLVAGKPEAERVDHLLMVINDIAERKVGRNGNEYVPMITLVTHSNAEQQRMQRLLRQRFARISRSRKLAFRLPQS